MWCNVNKNLPFLGGGQPDYYTTWTGKKKIDQTVFSDDNIISQFSTYTQKHSVSANTKFLSTMSVICIRSWSEL